VSVKRTPSSQARSVRQLQGCPRQDGHVDCRMGRRTGAVAVRAGHHIRIPRSCRSPSRSRSHDLRQVAVAAAPTRPPSCQPFVRPWPEAGSRWVGTPFVPTPFGGCGAQRRTRAAPLGAGTGATRSHAQPPFGGEHGEDGEDPPLVRSEHRGTSSRLRARAYVRAKASLRIQVFGAFFSDEFNGLSCGYPSLGAYIPSFGAYPGSLSRVLGREPGY